MKNNLCFLILAFVGFVAWNGIIVKDKDGVVQGSFEFEGSVQTQSYVC